MNAQIEHFLFALLVELSSNEPLLKQLRLSVMDLVFLILERQKDQTMKTNLSEQDSEAQLAQLPQNVRDLFTTIHTINALTDQTKQTVVPEQFFAKSKLLVGDKIQLTRDDFNKSNQSFRSNCRSSIDRFYEHKVHG